MCTGKEVARTHTDIACIVITRALVNLVSNHMTIFPQNGIFAGLMLNL